MSIMQRISKPADRPIIMTVLADSGLGKTSLAATFPKPIFIRAEDGLQAIPADTRPDAFPPLAKIDDLWEQLAALINEEHDYKTVVIDSVTKLETMFGQHVIDTDPKSPKSLAQAGGGYGAGFQAVAALHHRVRRAAQLLNDKGMHVVFIAHAETTTVELPDSDPYNRYDVRLHKKSVSPYVDDVDVVAFIKLRTFTVGDDDRKRAKAISDGTRVLVCYACAANVSKNRYGITSDIEFTQGQNPLAAFIPSIANSL